MQGAGDEVVCVGWGVGVGGGVCVWGGGASKDRAGQDFAPGRQVGKSVERKGSGGQRPRCDRKPRPLHDLPEVVGRRHVLKQPSARDPVLCRQAGKGGGRVRAGARVGGSGLRARAQVLLCARSRSAGMLCWRRTPHTAPLAMPHRTLHHTAHPASRRGPPASAWRPQEPLASSLFSPGLRRLMRVWSACKLATQPAAHSAAPSAKRGESSASAGASTSSRRLCM
jgi:hypothetical protein